MEENIAGVQLGNDASNFVLGEDYESDLDELDTLYRHDEENDLWVETPEEHGIAQSGHENGA